MSTLGLITRPSSHGAPDTIRRLTRAIEARAMTIFARIDHAAAAASAGLQMPPTEVVIFGNPRAGTLLMRKAPSLAIDLPLRALVWQDETDSVWLSYNDPLWIALRHDELNRDAEALLAMTAVLSAIADAATGSEAS